MVASLDGFIARKDGRVDWLETSDEFVGGDTMDAGAVEAFLKTIDCYVMGSRTYETALNFEAKGFGWSYGDKPVFVTSRGERYDLIFDAVGKRKSAVAMRDAARALTPSGKCMSIDDDFPKPTQQDLDLLARLAESGALKPVIDRRYRLEEIAEAHRYVELGHKKGNVMVTVDANRPEALASVRESL